MNDRFDIGVLAAIRSHQKRFQFGFSQTSFPGLAVRGNLDVMDRVFLEWRVPLLPGDLQAMPQDDEFPPYARRADDLKPLVPISGNCRSRKFVDGYPGDLMLNECLQPVLLCFRTTLLGRDLLQIAKKQV
ncbi:hypothetical protein GCM10007285_39380 [Stappia taiwanensis]|nr:hypothetical protein GCM10007285_39380 [Stappia taiwanensis]